MLTSVQEAAFAAFQEAAIELLAATGMKRLDVNIRVGDDATPFTFGAHTHKANNPTDYCFGYGPSVTAAVQDAATKFDASKEEPAILRNAKEAVEAVKQVIAGSTASTNEELVAAIDALPLA